LLAEDMAPVMSASDETGTEAVRSYAAQRVVQRLTDSICRALVDTLPSLEQDRRAVMEGLLPVVSSCLVGVVYGVQKPERIHEFSVTRWANALVQPISQMLRAGPPKGNDLATGQRGTLALRLSCLAAALSHGSPWSERGADHMDQ
jgi:hypothetical protein